MRLHYFKIFIVFIFVFVNFSIVSAQKIHTGQVEGPDRVLQVQISPENPGPGDTVTISIENYTYDLDKAMISWSVNGTLQQKRTGLKNFTTVLGKTGSKTSVSVTIDAVEGVSFGKVFNFNPFNVDIIWEAVTYIPSWYKGKALFTPEAVARVVAMTDITENGVPVDPKTLVYTWVDNDSIMKDQSGYGQNVYYFSSDIIARPHTISVAVSNIRGTVNTKKEIVIGTTLPLVRVYENSPTYGILSQSAITSDYALKKDEISVKAFPFYYTATASNDPKLKYMWQLNGQTINEQTSPLITFRSPSTEGLSRIDLEVDHLDYVLQAAQTAFSINFKKSETANGFSI